MKRLVTTLALTLSLASAAAAGDAPPPSAADGKKLWEEKKCAGCHGPDGKAQTKMGEKMKIRDMTTAEWQARFSDQQLVDVILKGVNREEDGRKIKKKPVEGATERDARAFVAFIRSLKAAEKAPPAPEKKDPPPAK